MHASVERLRARGDLLGGPEHAPLLREHDELGALARGVADQAVGCLEVAIDVFGRVKLDCAGAHRVHLSVAD